MAGITPAVLIAIIGVLVYLLAGNAPNGNPKISEVGRIMFFVGLFVALMGAGQLATSYFR